MSYRHAAANRGAVSSRAQGHNRAPAANLIASDPVDHPAIYERVRACVPLQNTPEGTGEAVASRLLGVCSPVFVIRI